MPTIFWEFPNPAPSRLAGVGRNFDNVDAAEKWFNEWKDRLLFRTQLVSRGNVFETTPEGFALAKLCEIPVLEIPFYSLGPTGSTGPAAPVE